MERDLTAGNENRAMLRFALPLLLGDILQQCYNVADTIVVGRFIGSGALGAVGTCFTLMVFLTSVIGGLCMGSGVWFSMLYGEKNDRLLKTSLFLSFVMIAAAAVVINLAVLFFLEPILGLLQVPQEIFVMAKTYMKIILGGIFFTFVYNFMSAFLRSIGNSAAPVICAAFSTVLNVALDLLFVVRFGMGVSGAALATVLAQFVSAAAVTVHVLRTASRFLPGKEDARFDKRTAKRIAQYASLTSMQQSIMNFGILMIQGLVNSFGVTVTAAFAAAVKIDAFAYMPVQDFGNAFSTFIAQNYGAGKKERIRSGIRSAVLLSSVFSLMLSAAVFIFAAPLMRIFVDAGEAEIIAVGVEYLRIEGAFYIGIGLLFLLYGYYRGVGRAGMSVVLTVISLGTRVALAYLLAPVPWIGLSAVWWAIPIGWVLADIAGFLYYRKIRLR